MTSEAVSRRRGDLRPGRRARRHRIVDGNDITRTKPDPEIFLRAAAGLGLPAGACVVFEDAEAGVTAALRAGCRVVGIGGRTFATADLTAATLSDVDLSLLFGPG